tara:strand:- start:146 stop:505 length:360 start_codon:yes stop_codon:yes gene_type:complete
MGLIKEIEKIYKINRLGLISKVSNEKLMYIQTCKLGYQRVWLSVGGARKPYSVHRLVAMKYVKGFNENRCDVNHIDGDKSNNNYLNLEWVTKSENQKHAYATGLQESRNNWAIHRSKQN